MGGMNLEGRYELARFPQAHGGMAEVWQARDAHLERPVIVKFLNQVPGDTDLVRRFRREALLTARLIHPGVPAVYDVGEHQGRPYLVLQRIEGLTLTDLVAEHHPLPVAWVASIGAQISSVLVAAQQIGLVHRDLKPSNVMLEPSGAVKVFDFGLAAVLDDDRYSRITQTGQSLGTVGYMAPEQILGTSTDHRTDLYGLGGTLFHLLTAVPPFDGATTMTTVRHQLNDQPPRPSTLRPEIPAVLDELVHALLAEHADHRPADAAEVYGVLAPLAGNLPPIRGVVDDGLDAVRSYAAIVGQRPASHHPMPASPTARSTPDPALIAVEAEQLFAAGQYRAAARCWRQLADQHEERHGADDPFVFEWRLKAARAHVPLGEFGRALRQLENLLGQRIRIDGPEDAAVLELRREIADLAAAHATAQ